MGGRGRNFGKTRTDGHIYQGDTLKHTFTKKYHNVSSGVSPKAENEVQQQMSTFVGWLGVVRWRKQASGECLIIESDPNLFPKFPGICDLFFFPSYFFLVGYILLVIYIKMWSNIHLNSWGTFVFIRLTVVNLWNTFFLENTFIFWFSLWCPPAALPQLSGIYRFSWRTDSYTFC